MKRLQVAEVKGWLAKIEGHVAVGDDEVAFSDEIQLMKTYIKGRAENGDLVAAEVTKSWDIKFKRYCA